MPKGWLVGRKGRGSSRARARPKRHSELQESHSCRRVAMVDMARMRDMGGARAPAGRPHVRSRGEVGRRWWTRVTRGACRCAWGLHGLGVSFARACHVVSSTGLVSRGRPAANADADADADAPRLVADDGGRRRRVRRPVAGGAGEARRGREERSTAVAAITTYGVGTTSGMTRGSGSSVGANDSGRSRIGAADGPPQLSADRRARASSSSPSWSSSTSSRTGSAIWANSSSCVSARPGWSALSVAAAARVMVESAGSLRCSSKRWQTVS